MTIENGVEEPLPTNYDANNKSINVGSAHNRGLSGGSAHNRGLSGGGSNHSRDLRRNQHGHAPSTAMESARSVSPVKQSLSGGSCHNRGLRRSQHGAPPANVEPGKVVTAPQPRSLSPALGAPVPNARGLTTGAIPHRSKSSDGSISVLPRRTMSSDTPGKGLPKRVFSGLRGSRKPASKVRTEPEMAHTLVQLTAAGPPPPPAAAMATPKGLPNSPKNSPQNSPQSSGKVLHRSRATTPGAVIEISTASASPSQPTALGGTHNRSLSGDSTHSGKVRGLSRATAPGAMLASTAIEPPAPVRPRLTPQPAQDSSGDGKIRGRARATVPGAVGEATKGSDMGPPTNALSNLAPKSKPEEGRKEDAQATRLKQIQAIMKDANLSLREKQVQVQQLMVMQDPGAATNEGKVPTGDPQVIRRKQMQEIMKDTKLSQQEKQAKMQQLMAGGMPKARPASPVSATEEESVGSSSGAGSSQEFDAFEAATEDPQAIRRKQIQEIMKDTSVTPSERQSKIQQLMAGGMPNTAPRSRTNSPSSGNQRRGLNKTIISDSNSPSTSSLSDTVRPLPGADLGSSIHSGLGNELVDGSMHSQMNASGRVSRRARIQTGATGHGYSTAQSIEPAPGVGGAPQGKVRRTVAAARPGAVSVTEPSASIGRSSTHEPVIGVGGAPQGKVRRVGTAPFTRPGATSVVEPSLSEPGATIGVGGAPLGKVRHTAKSAIRRPGAVSIVEPTPSEPGAATGVGGAPQGKFRRSAATAPAIVPGAVSVVGKASTISSSEPGSSTGIGGAPQGKFRRSAATVPTTVPGAMCVIEKASTISPSEPGASTGDGGPPQLKFRRSAATAPATMPGAMNVVEKAFTISSSEPGSSTGIGGAPQGKFRQSAATVPTTVPGAMSVIEKAPTISPSEPGASTGVGGAPQGKFRRSAATAPATMPGAMNVAEKASTISPSEPGASTSVGGAPQGKFRQYTANAPASRPGAMSVVEPIPSSSLEPGATKGVGGAPQGKFRRSTAQTGTPGAVSVVEPSPASSGPGTAKGVGGAPQGKFRRSTAGAVAPGAVSMVEPSALPEPGAARGVGGAPQGKFRRTATATTATPGAINSVAPSTSEPGGASLDRSSHNGVKMTAGDLCQSCTQEPSIDPVSSTRYLLEVAKVPRTLVPAVSVMSMQTSEHSSASSAVVSPVESDMLAKSSIRCSRLATVVPGAQSVASTVDSMGEDSTMITSAVIAPGDLSDVARKGGLRVADHSSRGFESASLSSRGLSNKNSTHGIVPYSSHSAASEAHASASFPSCEPSGQFDDESYDHDNPAATTDFDTAIQLVDDDIQAKMQARVADSSRPAVPGAMPSEASEAESNLRQKNPRFDSEEPEDDLDNLRKEKETVDVKIGCHSATALPSATQDRMELKIMQMEREQQSRDDKLEELDEANLRRPRHDRHKVVPSPHRGVEVDDESESAENGFLNPDPDIVRQAEEDGLAIAVAVEEEEPDVYEIELKMYDPLAKPPFYKNRRFRCYSTLIVCLVLGAIIAAIAFSAKKGGETIIITLSPSAFPSMAPTTTRETAVRGELARVIGDIINEPGTVFEKALDWILYDDDMQLNEFSENLIQRYTLALFYYQTSQEGEWISCNPPKTGENSTCEFLEMERNTDDNSRFYTPREDLQVRWLSEKHECEWAEIMCHPEADGNVIAIDILGQNLTGTLPEELKHLERLMWLSLSFNQFEGQIPEVYGDFSYLTIFEITENLITGQIPGGFFKQTNLLQLNPAFNMITGTIPPEIGDVTTLHSVFFFGTELEGTIPTEIGLLEDIRNLWLHDNQLTGLIPSEIGELSLLEELILANNAIIGPLPTEMGRLSSFRSFLFSGSTMDSTSIPEELFNATSLQEIDINSAGFGGTISTNIGKLTNLIGFKGSRNQFTGTLPSEIGLLVDSLQLLWVHFNELSGSVPLDICQLKGPANLQFLNADCAGFDPQITCLAGCCTGCCDEFGQCQSQ